MMNYKQILGCICCNNIIYLKLIKSMKEGTSKEKFESYENARQDKSGEDPQAISNEAVEIATKIINPDEEISDRG